MNQQINTPRRSSGFTLIELMLSMTFVAVLLMAIAMTIIQIANIYNRGMTVKEVNQASRAIADDMRRGVGASEVFLVNANGTDSADSFAVRSGSTVVGGRLCTGTFSYLWNIEKAVQAEEAVGAKDVTLTHILSSGGTVGDPIRFVKIPDTGKKYCLKASGALVNKNIVDADAKIMTDLLDTGDHKLGLQRLSITTKDSVYDASTGQRLYMVNYTLGTGDTAAMNSTQSACLPPGDPNSNLTYCNVQAFSIVLRVGSAVN